MEYKNNGVGNKWWKVDFHCHTPASNDFGKGSKQESLSKIEPEEYLKSYMEAQLDAIVITDHNSGAWVDKLKETYSLADVQSKEWFRPLVIFPGVELTVNGNTHLIAILDEKKGTSDIDSLLGAVFYKGTKGMSDGCTQKSFIDAVNAIIENGGIAIPAHIDQPKGLLVTVTGNSLEAILDNDCIFAAEIHDTNCSKPQIYIDKKVAWCRVLGSDAHHLTNDTGERYPGSHYTWIKMTHPSFEELELALRDGASSVICSDEIDYNPNEFSHEIIDKIVIRNAMYFGREKDFELAFSPWLNVIIGGRGTGKSTIVEFLRAACNRNSELPSELKTEFDKYISVRNGKESTGLMLEDTLLEVYCIKDEQKFKLSWSKAQGSKLFVFRNGDYEETEGDIVGRIPIRIYSQKQIFELAKDTEALLKIVDEAPEIQFKNWLEDYNQLIAKYELISAQIRELKLSLANNSQLRGELEDIDNKVKIWTESGTDELFKKYAQSCKKSVLIEKIQEYISKKKELYSGFVSKIEEIDKPMELDIAELDGDISSVWKEVLKQELEEKEKLAAISRDYISLSEKWEIEISSSSEMKDIASIKSQYISAQEKMREMGVAGVEDHQALINRKHVIEEKLLSENRIQEKIDALIAESGKLEDELLERRQLLTLRRKEFLNKVLNENSYVRMEIEGFSNISQIVPFLRKIMGKEKGFEKVFGGDEEKGIIINRIESKETIMEGVKLIKNDLSRIYHGEDVGEYDKKFRTMVQGLDESFLVKLSTWMPEDILKVSYSTDKGKYMHIDNASPGQKTAALLAFILSYGNEPLVLDQPEDDLDNSLISQLIVSSIRQKKTARQMIIVTHNANITVNGDSDNVIVMHSSAGQSRVKKQNGLQNIEIRSQICSILEGGKKAFEQRYKRINISGINDKE